MIHIPVPHVRVSEPGRRGTRNGDAEDRNRGEEILGEKGRAHAIAQRSDGMTSKVIERADGIGRSGGRFGRFRRKVDGRRRGRTMDSARSAVFTKKLVLAEVEDGPRNRRSEPFSDKSGSTENSSGCSTEDSSGGSTGATRGSRTTGSTMSGGSGGVA